MAKILLSVQYSNEFLSVLRKHLVIVNTVCSVFFFFFSAFHRSPSIGKFLFDSGIFCQDYGIIWVSLVIVNRQTSYDSGNLRQDYRGIRGLPINHTRFVFIGSPSG